MARLDPHSFNDSDQPEVERFDWSATVDFGSRTLDAEVAHTLRQAGGGPIDLDTRDLTITAVTDDAGAPIPFELAPAEPILGARLRVMLPAGTSRFRVRYRTSPTASALQWLTPSQTAGGEHPYLFSQCQAIHARSIIPIQDTPRIRVRYRAEITHPPELRALMAAAHRGGSLWEMPQPIPPYLIALAVGDLASRQLGPRSHVWAEPSVVDAAAHEFADVDAMLRAAESLFGPYDWEKFDLLCMPPSFPYGGMENPRLTFLTPTLLAGDRSLVSVVAHELAHSWTGNLVSNASAEHFWLNEGFTVFAERRIVERLYGEDVAALQAALGRRELEQTLERFGARPSLTHLRTSLAGIDPDEAFSDIPYEKGYLFLRTLEDAVGRARFDGFLRAYVSQFRFGAITTSDFEALVERELPGALSQINAAAWLDGPGLPPNAPHAQSKRLSAIAALGTGTPSDEQARAFTPVEWQLYLEAQPHPSPHERVAALDARFRLNDSGNYEILCAWLELAIPSGYAPAIARASEVLGRVGRMKYLRPLYRALAARPDTRKVAEETYARCKDGYHPIAQQVIEGVLRA
jgi:leukotriene-A4 hydrolase